LLQLVPIDLILSLYTIKKNLQSSNVQLAPSLTSNKARSAEDKWSLLLNLKELYCFISMENLALTVSAVRQCIDSCICKHLQMLAYLAA